MNHRPLVIGALLFTAACAISRRNDRPGEVHLAELDQLHAAQQVFREQNTAPIDFDFEGNGRVTVREVSLDGWPGGEYVRCRFHYQNRTSTPVRKAWISLDVLDASGRLVANQALNCLMPVPMPIARGAYYSNELRTPTYGAHLEPGWSWRIRCIAVPETEDEPLDPPAPEPGLRQSPPMIIKNRGQNNW